MKAIFAVFKNNKILKMSKNKKELKDYILSFPPEEQKNLTLKVKYESGTNEWQKGFWMNLEF